MLAAAHAIAITCYLGAALSAALPFARPVRAPVRAVTLLLAAGLTAHALALMSLASDGGTMALTGLGPSLSFAGLTVAAVLLFVELAAGEVTLTLFAAPLAALMTTIGNVAGLQPALDERGGRALWLVLHIVPAFIGIAAYATAAAAGTMYLVAHRDLKTRRFGAIFRFFPPLATLDRVNRVASLGAFILLTLGIALAASYAIAYNSLVVSETVWGVGAWIALAFLALGRLRGAISGKRAAVASAVTFAVVVILYVVVRVGVSTGGFL